MVDVQLDVAAANRFINSLSKSLQALCHGCMDFDAGIEIVGYLNINIDSGSKVDYVLNEKVLKSTTNSMTFVSNSFLAQKDNPKTSKDGSCSPIPELNNPPQKGGYSYPATQLYRSSGIYSPHSQVLRGSQKRAWAGGDWRVSPRKFARGAKSQYSSYQQHQNPTQHESYYSTDSSVPASSQHSSSTPQQDYPSSETQSDINIKKEVEDSTGDNSGYNHAAGGESTDQNSGAITDNASIKADPDAESTTKSETDVPNSFLEPVKTDDTYGEEQSNIGDNTDNTETNYDNSYDAAQDDSSATGENKNYNDESQGPSGVDAEYDESGEMYSHGSFAGEGSSSGGGQFEVIEIDDEDEDVAAMFNDSHAAGGLSKRTDQSVVQTESVHVNQYSSGGMCSSNMTLHSHPVIFDYSQRQVSYPTPTGASVSCKTCFKTFMTRKDLQKHINIYHRGAEGSMTLPYVCSTCHMGFYTQTGHKEHELKHRGALFQCPICLIKFTIKKVLKKHLLGKHKMKQCLYCKATYSATSDSIHVCERPEGR